MADERREKPRESTFGRRATDHCNSIEGTPDDCSEYGWIVTSKGKHVCPQCYLEHKEAVFTI